MKIRIPLHKNVQHEIVRRLEGQKVSIEKSFKAIRRVADVYWHEKKIVFEVQCSNLTLSEAIERTKDYQSIGITVIWLLHDKTFNRKIISRAERYLRMNKALYTNIDGLNEGAIYDQMDQTLYRTRLNRGRALPIDILDHKKLRNKKRFIRFKSPWCLKKVYERFLTKLYHST